MCFLVNDVNLIEKTEAEVFRRYMRFNTHSFAQYWDRQSDCDGRTDFPIIEAVSLHQTLFFVGCGLFHRCLYKTPQVSADRV